jgi:hypothetical protein
MITLITCIQATLGFTPWRIVMTGEMTQISAWDEKPTTGILVTVYTG